VLVAELACAGQETGPVNFKRRGQAGGTEPSD